MHFETNNELLYDELKMMRLSVDRAADSIFWLSRDGNIIYVNNAACVERGYSREELLGMKIFDLDPDYQSGVWEMHFEDLKHHGTLTLETRHRTKYGREYPVEVSANYIHIGDNEFNFCFLRDITERKKAEHKILASEEKWHLLFENMATGFALHEIICDAQNKVVDYRFLEVNPAYQQLTGLKASSIIGRTVLEVLPGTETYWIEIFGNVALSGEPTSYENYSKELGRWFGVRVFCPKLGQFAVMASDITERKRMEETLQFHSNILNNLAEGIVLVGAKNGLIVFTNPQFDSMFGYSAGELIGHPVSIINAHDDLAPEVVAQTIMAELARSSVWSGEIHHIRKNSSTFWSRAKISTFTHPEYGEVWVSAHEDITQQKNNTERIQHLAFYDHLTSLPNRVLLLDRLNNALVSSMRNSRKGALLLIDLDNFKSLNETLGHEIGDVLLQQVSQRLVSCIREGDTVARLGGDEFMVMLLDLSEQTIEAATQTETIGDKILTTLSQSYQLNKNSYRCTASIGVTLFSGIQHTTDELIKQADIAMYQAKKSGRNNLHFFDPKMQETINARVALERELHRAIESGQFQLHYQVQVDSARRPLGAEALIRWIHPERGMVSPAEFIPLAEEGGLILSIGRWVMETACGQLKLWEDDESTRNLILAINVSAWQFHQADFVEQVRSIIEHHGIKPKLLKLELTESLMLEDIDDTISTMDGLSKLGVRLSLDDFGTGYSSLQYLKRLPLDQLKIDQSFVHDISTDPSDALIVATIIAMADALGLEVIAEGVETEAQHDFLRQRGCNTFQGYLFGKPMPIERFEGLIKQR